MNLPEHEQQSIDEFGNAWTEVHVFLDQFQPRFRGPEHRRILHHTAGVNEVVRRFGEEARPVAELHIKMDWRGYCGAGYVPDLKEIDLDNWLLLNWNIQDQMDTIIKELYSEKV
jgi:hypothetical protein